ncbi:MAG: ABC transporter ATP-binding protein [Candidatus Sericytochromatia bacterium]|nr:ABC transporter ATP-binding protein [Candidatus Sericytochromatia bacterium]
MNGLAALWGDLAPGPSGMPAISVRGLRKRYGELQAVDDVSFDVAPGDFFAFLGPNGAGKTTTISAIVGLVQFQQGAISVLGHDVRAHYREARRAVGLAPQDFNFDRYLTVEEILRYQAGYFGVAPAVASQRSEALLRQFSLWDKRHRDVAKLSGGMKRRLTLARALIHAPRVLILDEPTAGVDLELRLELWDFLQGLNRQGLTILLTTHYLEEAEQLCNRVGIIDKGRLVALDDKAALLAGRSQERLELTFQAPVAELPPALAGLDAALVQDGLRLVVRHCAAAELPRILRALEAQGHHLADLAVTRSNLQDVFLSLTGRPDR